MSQTQSAGDLSIRTVVDGEEEGFYYAILVHPELTWQDAKQFMRSWGRPNGLKLLVRDEKMPLRAKLKVRPSAVVFHVHVAKLADFFNRMVKFRAEHPLRPDAVPTCQPALTMSPTWSALRRLRTAPAGSWQHA